MTDLAILDACFFIKTLNHSFLSCAGVRAELAGCETHGIRRKWHSILPFKEYPNCKYCQQLFISCNFHRSSSLILLFNTITMHLMPGIARDIAFSVGGTLWILSRLLNRMLSLMKQCWPSQSLYSCFYYCSSQILLFSQDRLP